MTKKVDALRQLNITNDANLCQRTKVIITVGRSPKASSSGGYFITEVIYAVANGTTFNVKLRWNIFGSGKTKKELQKEMQLHIGGEWERSPFSTDSFVPKGSVEKILNG